MQKLPTLFVAQFGLLFGAMCWGVIWYPYRLMNEVGVSGLASSVYTYGIAILIASVFCIKKWRHFHFDSTVFGISLIAGWTNIAYVLAIIDGEVMRVMLLFYLSPIWTMLLAHFWLKEKTSLKGVGIILLALLGAFIMLFDGASHTTWMEALPLPSNRAEWIALSSGIGFSITNVLTRKSHHLSITTKSFAVWFGVFMMAGCMMFLLKIPVPAPAFFGFFEWSMMVLIALMLIAATVLVQYGVTKISAMRASVLFLFELVVAAIASYYWANETMQWHEWLGGGLIILAGVLSAMQAEHSTH